jgi:dienelactone hydrolase
MYHAVADTILANSLLRSLPEVDADKVGLMGISWGGVITSTVVGIDNRFAFAIPVYGCGHLFDAQNQYGRSLGNNEVYKNVWDPMVRLENAKMPMLWFSWPQDSHFPLDCQAASYRAASGPRMLTLVPKMGHGHGPPWNRPEGYAFAKAIVQNGGPWCQQTEATLAEGECRVSFSSKKPFDKAVLVSTTDSGVTGERNWVESPAVLKGKDNKWLITAKLPAETTAWFVNAHSGDLVVSSEFEEIKD